MKKNTQFALTILTVSLLHAAGIVALSSFEDKPAELITTQEELTFVEIGSAPPPAAAPLVAPVIPPVIEKPKPPEIKRTIVKKPEAEPVIERKPEPKPEKKIEPQVEKPKPETKLKPAEKPAEKPTQNTNLAQNNTGSHQAAGSQGSGKGTAVGKEGDGKGEGKGTGSGEGNASGSGSGPTSGPKIAGSASCLSPVYPQESIDRGEAGSVKVRWTVGADGSVLNVEVTGSSGHARLDNAALRQAKKCRFSPALKGGVPVQNNYSRPYNFKIS